jgi:hypothetical protein
MRPRAAREEGGHPPHGLILSDSLARERSAIPRYNPGSQKALAFVTIPDNAFGVSGMTQRVRSNGGVPLPVGRPDFKSGWDCLTVSGGFDSHPPPPPHKAKDNEKA